MNPAIVIPSYWAHDPSQPGVYDHATATDEPMPELARCLDSLDDVRGVIRTIILLVAPPAAEPAARARVAAIARDHPELSPVIIGSGEARAISERIEEICPGIGGEPVSLRGYGAIRNMGLAACAVLGHDIAVFMDDDEVALTPDFLLDAVYGMGQLTRQDLPILAKTGHFIDAEGSHLASGRGRRLWELWWSKRAEFNEWMRGALSGTRICRSNYACGGCLAVHASAYSRVPFDPWITRGEDLDYLFDLRLLGLEMWFDGSWFVQHLPPVTPDEPNRFLQDVYRWTYERAKLEFCSRQQALRQVTASSLMPYPGRWISPEVEGRISRTALARAITGPARRANFRIWRHGRDQATTYARANASNYARLLSFWPAAIDGVWRDGRLAAVLGCASSVASETAAQTPAPPVKTSAADAGAPAAAPEAADTAGAPAAPPEAADTAGAPAAALETLSAAKAPAASAQAAPAHDHPERSAP